MSRFGDIVNSIEATFATPSVPFTKGRLASKENAAPPRVAWIQTGAETFGPPAQMGGREVAGVRSRSFLTRLIDAEAWIWGTDEDETEAILHSLLSAVFRTLTTNVVFAGGAWRTQDDDVADYAVKGQLYVLSLRFTVPVEREAAPLKTLGAQTHAGVFLDPAGGPSAETVC